MRCADSECSRYGSTVRSANAAARVPAKTETGRRLRAQPAGQRTGKRRNYIRPRPGNAYNEKDEGIATAGFCVFDGRTVRKPQEPLPDIEA